MPLDESSFMPFLTTPLASTVWHDLGIFIGTISNMALQPRHKKESPHGYPLGAVEPDLIICGYSTPNLLASCWLAVDIPRPLTPSRSPNLCFL